MTRVPSDLGLLAAGVEDLVHRRFAEVGQVHRDLAGVEFVDVPADALDVLEAARLLDRLAVLVADDLPVLVALGAALLPDAQGDLVGQALVAGVDVHVVGDQEFARR